MSAPAAWRARLLDWLAGDQPVLFLPEAEADDEQLISQLEQAGFDPVAVDLAEVVDKSGLMAAMRDALGLDAWFGANWDALSDALYGPEAPIERAQVLVLQLPPSGLELDAADLRILLDIVAEVAGSERSTLRGAIVTGGGAL